MERIDNCHSTSCQDSSADDRKKVNIFPMNQFKPIILSKHIQSVDYELIVGSSEMEVTLLRV